MRAVRLVMMGVGVKVGVRVSMAMYMAGTLGVVGAAGRWPRRSDESGVRGLAESGRAADGQFRFACRHSDVDWKQQRKKKK